MTEQGYMSARVMCKHYTLRKCVNFSSLHLIYAWMIGDVLQFLRLK